MLEINQVMDIVIDVFLESGKRVPRVLTDSVDVLMDHLISNNLSRYNLTHSNFLLLPDSSRCGTGSIVGVGKGRFEIIHPGNQDGLACK